MADTLSKLRKLSDFKPLNVDEAYSFLNQYYLPRLDSIPTKRKIFVHPLNGFDFKELFNKDSVKLVKEYSADTSYKSSDRFLTPPQPLSININKKFSWDNNKLIQTKIIKEYISSVGTNVFNSDKIKAWHKKYGFGYMYVSYPQFNAYTKRLVIREYIEDYYFCGTGREHIFWFTKTPRGWLADTEH